MVTVQNHQKRIPIPTAKIKAAAQKVLTKLKAKNANLSLVFVSPQRMRQINRDYLKHDYVTDVITFDLGDHDWEIFICPSMAAHQAKEFGTSKNHELILYVIHGILHCLGYDDHKDVDIKKMCRKEKELMKVVSGQWLVV